MAVKTSVLVRFGRAKTTFVPTAGIIYKLVLTVYAYTFEIIYLVS